MMVARRQPNAPEFNSGDRYHPSRIDSHTPSREAAGMQKCRLMGIHSFERYNLQKNVEV